MITITHDQIAILRASGRAINIDDCICGKCSNIFFVVSGGDFAPKFCPYCGICFSCVSEDCSHIPMNDKGIPLPEEEP